MKRRPLFIILVLALTFLLSSAAVAQGNQLAAKNVGYPGYEVSESVNGIYIVQLLDNPVVSYEGDIKGLKATKPQNGKKIDPNSPAVLDYVSYLDGQHNATLAKVNGKKVKDF